MSACRTPLHPHAISPAACALLKAGRSESARDRSSWGAPGVGGSTSVWRAVPTSYFPAGTSRNERPIVAANGSNVVLFAVGKVNEKLA